MHFRHAGLHYLVKLQDSETAAYILQSQETVAMGSVLHMSTKERGEH